MDGEKQTLLDKNGDVVYPITYDGTTYLPIRALGNAMDLEVEWNSKTQTVSLYTKTDTKPEDLTLEKLTERTEEAEDTVAELKAASTYAGRKDPSTICTARPSTTSGTTCAPTPNGSTPSTWTAS